MSRIPSVTTDAAQSDIQPIAAIRAAQEAVAYFKPTPRPQLNTPANLSALDAMYAYYSA